MICQNRVLPSSPGSAGALCGVKYGHYGYQLAHSAHSVPNQQTHIARRPRCKVSCVLHLPVHFPLSISFTYQSPSPSHCHSAPPLVPRLASLSILPQFNSLHPSPKNLHQPTTSLYSPLQLNRDYTSLVTILRLFGSCLSRLPKSTTLL